MTFPIIYNREDQVVPVKSWMSFDPQFDSGTVDQVRKTATLPWAHSHVALMADGHVGKGCTVGSVIALKDAVSPAAVGIDIGCSMRATRTSLTAEDLPETLLGLRSRIEGVVPVGFSSHASLPKLSPTANVLMKEFDSLDPGIVGKKKKFTFEQKRGVALKQIGTLGGGRRLPPGRV